MGLAGQKEKQRISSDPNNLNWSKDESKFGFKMLQKMGWSPGKGLGVNEDGKKEHIKIKLKDNTLGVGATKKSVDNWLGNTDAFSRLLADLNSQTPSETSSVADESQEEDDTKDKKKKKEKKEKKDKKEKKEKKDKKEKKEKKDKKEKKEKKDKKDKEEKKRKRDSDDDKVETKKAKTEEESKPAVVLRNAARAKFLRAKKMATSNSGDKSHLNEILGIKSSSSTTTTTNNNQGYQTFETSSSTFMAAFTV